MKRVGVLIFVDQDVVESSSDFRRQPGFFHHMVPVEKEIVIIEHIVMLLRLDVPAKQLSEFIGPIGAPGKYGVQRSR